MNLRLILSLVFLSFAVLPDAGARPAAGDACGTNCVVMARDGQSLMVMARNGDGDLVASRSIGLPASVVLSEAAMQSHPAYLDPANQNGLPVGASCSGTPGVCTEHATLSYETATQIVIVTITYFFVNGELLDLDVDETRISKSRIK